MKEKCEKNNYYKRKHVPPDGTEDELSSSVAKLRLPEAEDERELPLFV